MPGTSNVPNTSSQVKSENVRRSQHLINQQTGTIAEEMDWEEDNSTAGDPDYQPSSRQSSSKTTTTSIDTRIEQIESESIDVAIAANIDLARRQAIDCQIAEGNLREGNVHSPPVVTVEQVFPPPRTSTPHYAYLTTTPWCIPLRAAPTPAPTATSRERARDDTFIRLESIPQCKQPRAQSSTRSSTSHGGSLSRREGGKNLPTSRELLRTEFDRASSSSRNESHDQRTPRTSRDTEASIDLIKLPSAGPRLTENSNFVLWKDHVTGELQAQGMEWAVTEWNPGHLNREEAE